MLSVINQTLVSKQLWVALNVRIWSKISLTFDLIYFLLIFSDLLHGRRIARALWDYYKVSGIITDSCYVDPRDIKVSLFNFCFQYFCDIDNLMEMILFSGF